MICCFCTGWYSILLIYDSVSKYATIKCLCDNSRHAVILLTFSAWDGMHLWVCGLFSLKIHSVKKEVDPKHYSTHWDEGFGQKSFLPFLDIEPILLPKLNQVKTSLFLEPPAITKWWNLRSATETSQTGINTKHLTY